VCVSVCKRARLCIFNRPQSIYIYLRTVWHPDGDTSAVSRLLCQPDNHADLRLEIAPNDDESVHSLNAQEDATVRCVGGKAPAQLDRVAFHIVAPPCSHAYARQPSRFRV
jgi:hypothetical protein